MSQSSLGTKLKIGANSIADLTSIGGLQLSKDTIENTTLDSDGWRSFAAGLKDAGEVPISGYFNPSDTNGQNALYTAFNDDSLLDFSILFPAALGASWNFKGIVTGFSTGVELEDNISFEATIKVSGKPSLGLTPSAGLTALALTGAGGVLTPSFANGIYSYAFSGVTATSVTLTATAANHNLALYIDGAFSQNLVSGSASAAIPMSAIGSKKLTILANEIGKTQKVYEVVVVKTA
jgi:predicted secreted protein